MINEEGINLMQYLRNMDQRTLRYIGIGLIAVGAFAALRLWFLLPLLVLGGVGAFLYVERRREGRIAAAVQSGLWLVGMGVLLLINFVFPGVLLLAGASLLLRGHEAQADQRVSEVLGRLGVQLPATGQPAGAHNVAIEHSAAQSEPNTGETTRL
jgi:hypothetical protein